MTSAETYAQIRQALKSELQRHRGHIRDIESGLDRSEGYLSKVCRGDISIPLEVLLKSLELIGADPAQFFGKALAMSADPAEPIRAVAETISVDRQTETLLASLHEMADAALGDAEIEAHLWDAPATSRELEAVETIGRCSVVEQRRRLRATKKYRTVGFACAYLDDLASRRSSDPDLVARLSATFTSDFVIQLRDARPAQRFVLALRGLIEYVHSKQLVQEHGLALAAVWPALALARRHEAHRPLGELWKLGGRSLANRGRQEQALAVYKEALVCFTDLGLELESASIHLDRAMSFRELGRDDDVARCVGIALQGLDRVDEEKTRVPRATAHQLRAGLLSKRGQAHAAFGEANRAIEALGETAGVRWAMVTWQVGRLAMSHELHDEAEEIFVRVQHEFSRLKDLNAVLVALDLTLLKIQTGRWEEATRDAQSMAAFLTEHPGEPVLEKALTQFLRLAVQGQMTVHYVETCRREIEDGLRDAAP